MLIPAPNLLPGPPPPQLRRGKRMPGPKRQRRAGYRYFRVWSFRPSSKANAVPSMKRSTFSLENISGLAQAMKLALSVTVRLTNRSPRQETGWFRFVARERYKRLGNGWKGSLTIRTQGTFSMHEKVEGIGPAIEEWKQTSRITERPIFRPINKMSSRTALLNI